jgi:hypothetical protein
MTDATSPADVAGDEYLPSHFPQRDIENYIETRALMHAYSGASFVSLKSCLKSI